MKLPIYMDHHATTPVDPRVLEVMLPYFTDVFGNASSKNHSYGSDAEHAVEAARQFCADSIKAQTKEIFFTSGSTEALNLAIKGVATNYRDKGRHIITVATEHPAVLDCYDYLSKNGFTTTILGVNRTAGIDLLKLSEAIRPDTILVSVMAANNEVGTVYPLAEIGALCRERSVLFLTDATQAIGRFPIDVTAMNIDLLCMSAHKFYGPKGVGALYIRKKMPRVTIAPLQHGGGHEKGLRSGTLNVPGIVGLGRALKLSIQLMKDEMKAIGSLRDFMQNKMLHELPLTLVNGDQEKRLANNLSITFIGVESQALLLALKDTVAASAGSACSTERVEPSHVLKAMGLEEDLAFSTVRFSLGRSTTEAECKIVVEKCVEEVKRLRTFHPLYNALAEKYANRISAGQLVS